MISESPLAQVHLIVRPRQDARIEIDQAQLDELCLALNLPKNEE